MSVYILVLAFFLQGGLVMTQSIVLPDGKKETCDTYKPLIVNDYKSNKIHFERSDLPVEHLVGACVRLSSE